MTGASNYVNKLYSLSKQLFKKLLIHFLNREIHGLAVDIFFLIFLDNNDNLIVDNLNKMSSEVDTSNLMYLPYYMPDVSFNKVKYSNNLLKNGSILITDPVDGIIDINQKFLGQFKNDYIYQPNIQSTTWNIARQNVNNEQLIYFNGSSNNNTQSTKVNQNSIQNFNYNTIFGLTQADPSVIDWNYYNTTTNNTLSDAEFSRLGPKLFLYNIPENNYKTGNVTLWGEYSTTTTIATSVGNLSISQALIGMDISPIDPSKSNLNIETTTRISSINDIWPYKVQPKDTQYYNILTNGYNEALLALPKVETTTRNQYLLTTKINPATNRQEYSYTDLGDIIQNNYHYIVSYFDTRPTVYKKNYNFQSTISSLFLENLIQFFPIANFNYSICEMVHGGDSSMIASCLPFAWTTTPQTTFPNASIDDMNSICPIQLEWGKNITITTELNYTCANMVNLSNILTGWNYYGTNFSNPPFNNNNIYSRVNAPYVNIGLVLYVPNENTGFYSNTYEGLINTCNSTNVIVQYDNNGIPVNYYVEIMGNKVILDIDLNSNAKYLPKITGFNSGVPLFNKNNITYYELNGILYQIAFFQKDVITYNDVTINNLQNTINRSFKATVTTTNSIPLNIQINGNVKIFSFGGNNYSLDIGDNEFVYNGYQYKINNDNTSVSAVGASTIGGAGSFQESCVRGSWPTSVTTDNQYNDNLNLNTGGSLTITNYSNIPFYYNTYSTNNCIGSFGNEEIFFVKPNTGNTITGTIRGLSYTITTSSTKTGSTNKFAKYVSWLKSFFNDKNPWADLQKKDFSNISNSLEIYDIIEQYTQNYPTNSTSSEIQYIASCPCCLPFEITENSPSRMYQSGYFDGSNPAVNYDFLNLNSVNSSGDLIKLVSTYSVPITNALNTTHNSVDTMTFRFEKPNIDGVTDYYYIIGLYMYITKGQPVEDIGANPHFIGFSPSTNILNTGILHDGDFYGIPRIIDNNYVKNTTNLYNDNYQNSILMKDWLTTPSIFMSINESTGNNL